MRAIRPAHSGVPNSQTGYSIVVYGTALELREYQQNPFGFVPEVKDVHS